MLKKKQLTPEKPKAVGFFNHFPANFLRPYGLANDPSPIDTLNRRTNPKSCEWLIRPNYAMSEFSATIHENVEYLKGEKSSLLSTRGITKHLEAFEHYLPSLQRLNNKLDEAASEEDVTNVLTMLYDDESSINETMSQFFKIGGAMFSTAIHYMVAQNLLADPQAYACRLSTEDERAREFQSKRDLKSMKEMLVDMCVTPTCSSTSSTPSTSKKSLLQQLKGLKKKTCPTNSKIVLRIFIR